MMDFVIFSNLRGTMLDYGKYTFNESKESLDLAKKKEVPIVLCTSKTKEETELYRKKIGNKDPFIVENGGAIFVPLKYFSYKFKAKRSPGYMIIELNKDFMKIKKYIKDLKKKFSIETFDEMAPALIGKMLDVPPQQAAYAKKRKYSYAFKVSDKDEDEVLKLLRKKKWNYYHENDIFYVTGKASKKDAVKNLNSMFKRKKRGTKTMGIGCCETDFEMLKNVDFPFLVQKKNSKFASDSFNKVKGKGPIGWSHVVKQMLM